MKVQYDMFDSAPPASENPQHGEGCVPPALTEDQMVAFLQATGRYRILAKLQPRPIVRLPDPAFPLRGVLIDTETTGLNWRTDEVIEIGAVAFSFDQSGGIGEVTGVYGALQQPSAPIPSGITRLTGITDEMVAGKAIDYDHLSELIEPADLIIAHNATFDRPFCEKLSPVFSDKAWACSVSEVDWQARGYEGTKLGYLICQAGYFHDGHRAIDDCHALLEVLDRRDQQQPASAFAELFTASQRCRVRIFAENSPFELKDHLKARGYRWSDGSDGRPKAWWTEVPETGQDAELTWLRHEIYRYETDIPMQRLTAFDRFKA